MAGREDTPEDFARLAAELRGQSQVRKAEANRALLESIHPSEPEPEPESDSEAEEFVARLFAPKPGEVELIRRLHPEEGE
ncbi:MAG: hypothetical protein AABM42_10090 [Actinomycetota bacterium]